MAGASRLGAFLCKGVVMPKSQVRGLARRNSLLAGILAVVIAAGGVWYALFGGGVAAKPGSRPQAHAVPVTVATVARQDVPLLMEGIGTVKAFNTVTVMLRVDGMLLTVIAFTEGQTVKAGDLLAQIHPRPFQAALDQAVAKKAQDEAQLANAKLDLQRFDEPSPARQFTPVQQLSCPARATVAQLEAQDPRRPGEHRRFPNAARLHHDRLADRRPNRESAWSIRATSSMPPISTDIVVVTQLRPISVVFTLPELQDLCGAVVQSALVPSPAPVDVLAAGRDALAAAGAGYARGPRQPDRPDHRDDTPQGHVRQSGRRTLAGRIRRRPGLLAPDRAARPHRPVDRVAARASGGYFVYTVFPDDDGRAAMRPVQVGQIRRRHRRDSQAGLSPGRRWWWRSGQYRLLFPAARP